ncbi:hypothetical protein O3G_MSEX000980 [Manduca sexta]|nr:hypothetical protein O3G_MSEX000980 [Manduca sexta]
MSYIVLATIGYGTLPFMLMGEAYPLQIRGMLVGVSLSVFNLFMFFTNFIFVYETKYLGFANTMIMFGIVSLVCK